MNRLAQELDKKLQQLDPKQAEMLRQMVRDAMKKVSTTSESDEWPEGYFDEILGSFANEPLERAPQGKLPERDDW